MQKTFVGSSPCARGANPGQVTKWQGMLPRHANSAIHPVASEDGMKIPENTVEGEDEEEVEQVTGDEKETGVDGKIKDGEESEGEEIEELQKNLVAPTKEVGKCGQDCHLYSIFF